MPTSPPRLGEWPGCCIGSVEARPAEASGSSAAFVLTAVLLAVFGQAAGGETKDTFEIPGTESQQAFDLLDARFPQQSGSTANVVFHARTGTLDDAARRVAVAATIEQLGTGEHVVAVTDPYDAQLGAMSQDRTIAYAEVRYDVRANSLHSSTFDELERAGAPARDGGCKWSTAATSWRTPRKPSPRAPSSSGWPWRSSCCSSRSDP